jgi:hypothetical protein
VALNAAFFALEGNRDIYAWDSLAEEAKVTAKLFARMASSGILGGQEAIIIGFQRQDAKKRLQLIIRGHNLEHVY